MDKSDLGGPQEPERKSQSHVLGRLDFVTPPELPAPEYASVAARGKALAIDALLWLVVAAALGAIFGGVSSSNGLFRIKIGGPPFVMATVLWLVYMTLMEAKHGASVGKRARGLRVVMEDGGHVTAEAALLRNLLRFLDAFPYVVPYLVGGLAASKSPHLQRYGDRVAETTVISVPAGAAPGGRRRRLRRRS
jgi:uncharacterized RDD family membrane protein YckC